MIDLDLWLGEDDVFDAPYHRRQEWLVESLRQSYRHHVANDPRYRDYAQRYPLTADALVAATIDAIPLMPIGAFKRGRVPGSAGTVQTTSSGMIRPGVSGGFVSRKDEPRGNRIEAVFGGVEAGRSGDGGGVGRAGIDGVGGDG